MDNLSSSDLDAPSKTPLFIALAAVIVGLAGLALGWLGFSRAAELEQQIERLSSASAGVSSLESQVSQSSQRVERLTSEMSAFSQEVRRVLGAVEEDVSGIKKNVRAVAIEAGTAKKMVEELEKRGSQVAATPAPAARTTTVSEDSGSGAGGTGDSGKGGGSYTIKSGDTLGRIADAYGISLSDLLAANPGIDPRRLRIGQQIVIPEGE